MTIFSPKKNYLKTADVQGGEEVTILDAGEWQESRNYKYEDGSPKKDYYIKIKILDLEKDMRFNSTNLTIMQEAYGMDSADWVGKRIRLTKEKVMVGREKKDTIVVEIILEQ